MTEQTQPTDAELIDVWAQFVGDPTPKLPLTDADKVAFARAVLAKWGTPAGAVEVVACGNCGGSGRMVRDPDIGTDQECFVCDGSGSFSEPVTQQPTQAQAGAPRVSPEQWQALFDDQKRLVELANSRADIAESMLKAVQAQAGAVPFNKAQRTNLFNNRDLASEKNMGVKLTLAEWHRIVQYIESAHGIKGADHG